MTNGDRIPATIKGAQVAVQANLDKEIYGEGEPATLHMRIENISGGTFPVFTRIQLGDTVISSPTQELQDHLEITHVLPVDEDTEQLFFGVYMETGRALMLDTRYVIRKGGLVEVTSDKQTYDLTEPVLLSMLLTEEGRAYFDEADTL